MHICGTELRVKKQTLKFKAKLTAWSGKNYTSDMGITDYSQAKNWTYLFLPSHTEVNSSTSKASVGVETVG